MTDRTIRGSEEPFARSELEIPRSEVEAVFVAMLTMRDSMKEVRYRRAVKKRPSLP